MHAGFQTCVLIFETIFDIITIQKEEKHMTVKEFLTNFENGIYSIENEKTIVSLWESYECPKETLYIKLIPIYEMLHNATQSMILNNFKIYLTNTAEKDIIDFECNIVTGFPEVEFRICLHTNTNPTKYDVLAIDENQNYLVLFSTEHIDWIHTFLNNVNVEELETACDETLKYIKLETKRAKAEIKRVKEKIEETKRKRKQIERQCEYIKEQQWLLKNQHKKPFS